MSLSPGDKLGPYEILALIGKGGMGEVYRAHDDRLRRDVAIKVSNAEFSERFTREARTVASLNHTNIAHLYDVGPNYLVMELVEGEDLKGPLSFDDALPIIQQLIDGIEAAHEKGIVHRDLKPANIKITPKGVVKILDFGLAKATDTAPSPDADPNNSPTLTIGATAVGTILGTAAYMAPEQAKGKTADKRSDIWSFGVVVYELLTGKRMFAGESAVEILGGVLNKAPNLSAAPARAHKLLRWCLEKDRKQRLASISDARGLLNEEAVLVAQSSGGRGWVWPALAGTLVIALGIALWAPWRSAPPAQPQVRFQVEPPEKGEIGTPALSPDGRMVAFVSKGQLWIHSFETLESHAVSGTEGATYPFWSPDSANIGFFANGSVKKIAIAGGSAQTLAPATAEPVGATWNQNGVILFVPGVPSVVFQISASGGTPVAVTKAAGSDFHVFPQFLPDGNHFLYAVYGDKDSAGTYVGSLDGTAPKRVLPEVTNASFSQGHLLFRRGDSLMAQPFDTSGLRVTGDAVPLVEGIAANLTYSAFSSSDTGMLAYVGGASGGTIQLAWVDRSGKSLGLFGPPASYSRFQLSPDEKQITYDVQLEDVWVMDSVRGVTSRLTFDLAQDNFPLWSPDGQKIVWSSHRGGSYDLYVKAANGTGQEEPLIKMGSPTGWAMDWTKDGKLLYQRSGGGTGQDLWIAQVNASDDKAGNGKASEPKPYLNTPLDEGAGRFSPDGKWVAYTSNETGVSEVYVQTFPISGAKFQISTGGGSEPQWSKDGTELFYLSGNRTLMAVPIMRTTTEPFRPGLPKPLFHVPPALAEGIGPRSYAVSNDGKRFLISNGAASGSATPLTAMLNWRAGFKK
jgi:eukaryotic-like serine/threonine-protein kinase